MMTVLHVAPHPDDESLGAPCTLLSLAARGARVVVAACGLGSPEEHTRRRAELEAATATARFELVVHDPPAALSSGDDLRITQRDLTAWMTSLFDEFSADLVVGPHLQDDHPAHELVARAIADSVPEARRPPVWWAWGIWRDLAKPTLLVPCSDELVHRAATVLGCYEGELSRNDFRTMLHATGQLNAVRGVERVLGYGAAALPGVRHAELLTELQWESGSWRLGIPRVDPEPTVSTGWNGPVDILDA